MFEDGGILPGTSVKTLVGSDPPVILENFNCGVVSILLSRLSYKNFTLALCR